MKSSRLVGAWSLPGVLAAGFLLFAPPASAGGVEDTGDILRWALPAAAVGATVQHRDWRGFWKFAWSFSVAALTTAGLKSAIKSRRPDDSDNDSFPSGHTTNAFSGASFLDHRYGWRYGVPAYLAASFVAFSRVDADKHRVQDVVAAAAISWGIDHVFTDLHPNLRATADRNGAFLRLNWRW